VDLNHRPLGYEPNELPDCSTPQCHHSNVVGSGQTCGEQLESFHYAFFFPSMSLRTLNDVFFAVVERQHPKVMLQRVGLEWGPN
jgi:hypothetical protein